MGKGKTGAMPCLANPRSEARRKLKETMDVNQETARKKLQSEAKSVNKCRRRSRVSRASRTARDEIVSAFEDFRANTFAVKVR